MLRQVVLKIPPLQRLYDQREALRGERDDLATQLTALNSRPLPPPDSPFYHYNAAFDPQEIIRRHAAPTLHATPGYLTNFLGVLIDPKFFPHILEGKAGAVESIPIPSNWHADIAEWGAALRAVDLARDRFTVVELGCGWGCWMNNTGIAARRAGLDVHMVGIEADEGHLEFARSACVANGFSSSQVTLHCGVAAGSGLVAQFPRQEQAGVQWGLKPVFGATEKQNGSAWGDYCNEVPIISLAEVAKWHERIDLLHVDIQGGEVDLIASGLQLLREQVAYLVVGTHSRSIEGSLMDMLLAAGWTLEIERPAIFSLENGRPETVVDGVQGWRNPFLLPASGQ